MAGTRLDVSVVLPTYNESASLPVLVPRIAQALEGAGLNGEIIVVDDNSPDGTADVARELSTRFPVRVQKRVTERGLATAVITGFKMSAAEVCVVMDADGSHPVEALGNMVRLIQEDKAEIVVGSRHVPGGGSKDWPLFSQLKSRFAASLAFALNTSMTDPTTGFMAIRRTLLDKLELDPVGWKIVLETVVKAHPARLAEVPIVFTDREHGESKQSLSVLGQYLEHLYKLYKFRYPAFIELLKFCLVGFLGLFVDLSVVSSLKLSFGMDTRLCQVFGFSAAVTFNYAINRRFSFERARETPLFWSYVAYVGTNLIGLTVRMLAIAGLMRVTSLDRGNGYLLLSVIGIALATMVNFVGVKYFAFAPERLAREAGDDAEPNLEHTGPGRGRMLALGTAGVGALFAIALLAHTPRTHDELVNLTMADNIRAGFEGFVHPSVTPGFPRDFQRDALPALGNTPIYPLLLSWFARAGEPGLALSCALAFAVLLAALAFAWSKLDRGAAAATTMLAASAPWLVLSNALLEFEPWVAAFGMLGFAALTRTGQRANVAYAALAGAFVGLGFATKMWLVLPAAFACIGFLVSRTYTSAGDDRRAFQRASATFASTFALVGASHLAFVALVSPEDLRAWVDWVYLGIFSGRGATGPKLSGGAPVASQADSPFAYALWLMRDHGALFVPIVLGLPAATRRVGPERRAWFAAILAALLGLVPLSVPLAKEPLYMLPVLPFLYLLAGLTLVAPDRTPPRYARVNRGAAKASLVVATALGVGWIVAAFVSDALSLPVALLHIAHIAVWTAPTVLVMRGGKASAAVLPAALASLLLTVGLSVAASHASLP